MAKKPTEETVEQPALYGVLINADVIVEMVEALRREEPYRLNSEDIMIDLLPGDPATNKAGLDYANLDTLRKRLTRRETTEADES